MGGKQLACVAALLVSGWLTAATALTIAEYATPTSNSSPSGVTTGPDGALWFTETSANQIGRITAAGVVTEYPVVTAAAQPYGIVTGSDGALWFTELNANKIGRITISGVITEYSVPTPAAGPNWITAGPDGALWFTEQGTNQIGRITTAGTVTEYLVPALPPYSGLVLNGIAAGSDGALWFAGAGTNNNDQCFSFPFCLLPFIGQISTAGTVTEYSVVSENFAEPYAITSGPDGALWFTDGAGQIGRITTAANVTRYSGPNINNGGWGITTGADGALWFTEGPCIAPPDTGQGCGLAPPAIGRITTDGFLAEYLIPSTTAQPVGIAAGPNGTMWFAESGSGGNKIGTFAVSTVPGPPTVTGITPAVATAGTSVTISGTNFTGVTTVNFGTRSSASFTINSTTSIIATCPQGAEIVDVTVATPGGTSATTAVDRFTYRTTAHDFNGDGKSDVLWRDTAGDVGLWLMNGSQILQGAAFTAVPLNWSIVGQRDFNGDGKADILWRDTAGDVGLWLMNGTQVVQGTAFSSVPLNWSIVGTGDFNGDGKADILWLDNANNVGIWFMNGTQIVQAGVVGQLPAGWAVVGSDMNGDIFLRNMTNGDLGMWVMNGTQIAQGVDLGSLPLTWSVAGIGDFDGNGSFDILLRDTSGNVQIWLLSGTQVLSTKMVGNVSTSWSIAATGDFNGDGKSDILWIDNAGNLGVWFMDGATISSVVNYGNVGSAWSVQSLNAD